MTRAMQLVGLLLVGCIVSEITRQIHLRAGWLVVQSSPQPTVKKDEHYYQEKLADRLKVAAEEVLWDGSRVDLLSETEAFEIDWAPKWKEAIGQSLYYALVTGRRPAIILLYDGAHDDRFVYRCQSVCARHDIRLVVEPTER